MSATSARAYIERMRNDELFARRVLACADAEQRTALVRAEGYDFSRAEIGVLAQGLNDDLLRRATSQESRLGYDSELGHGVDPPKKIRPAH
ncbi:Nif11-like leader peptide family natural product precursor [Parasulfuritortus cantonensis]|uniref:Nif11-like leader peptide family natural product n=1 Tax=Parasulfuritortus cantonensis TaxID=2528202 RepID=A0A4R1BIP9_9PROT|nr:Nif11-like leader peptide family natural product precursor [Parasulfuritortus cantonensis]TCJ17205.1 Nif11-like leader peptide family natural product precursor [Parasulfuritortus cantonensis]